MPSDSEDPIPRLSRGEVSKAIERRGPSRIPLVMARWWGEGLREQYGERLTTLERRYPMDIEQFFLDPVDYKKMGLSWELPEGGPHDSAAVVDDWAKLDEFIEKMPDPETDPAFERFAERLEQARRDDMYVCFGWWRFFFERPWGIRGMESLMLDYYEHPDRVHKLHGALCDQYIAYLRRALREMKPDGFWTSDDLGHQTQPMMSPVVFREMIKPYYDRVGEVVREGGMHWWLHSCGNNTPLLDDLIDAGVTVFHPVQKGTMDAEAVVRDYGDRLAFLAGFDVQHVLPEANPEAVRAEVRAMIDTFDRPDGGMGIAAGNGIVAGTPLENIEAFLDEAVRYGTAHRHQMNATGA